MTIEKLEAELKKCKQKLKEAKADLKKSKKEIEDNQSDECKDISKMKKLIKLELKDSEYEKVNKIIAEVFKSLDLDD